MVDTIMKTAEEIQQQIEGLRELKPFVNQHSAFGDDNHEQIEAQIEVLEKRMNVNQVEDYFCVDEDLPEEERTPEVVVDSAHHACDWMYGRDSESPLESWKILDSRKDK